MEDQTLGWSSTLKKIIKTTLDISRSSRSNSLRPERTHMKICQWWMNSLRIDLTAHAISQSAKPLGKRTALAPTSIPSNSKSRLRRRFSKSSRTSVTSTKSVGNWRPLIATNNSQGSTRPMATFINFLETMGKFWIKISKTRRKKGKWKLITW